MFANLEKPIIHVTHKRADPDTFAGVYWGLNVFGGCSIVDSPRRVVLNLMRRLNFTSRKCPAITTILYDTNRYEDVPEFTSRLVIIDHHPWLDPALEMIAEKVIRRPRSCLAMNLYDMSKDAGLKLPDEVLLSFALALITDTAILRTASSEELLYLSKFLNGRKMEEVFKLAFEGVVDPITFAREIEKVEVLKTKYKICHGRFSSDENFMYFIDTFMYVLGCRIVVGKLDWGIWVYTEKSLIQKVYPLLKDMESKGYRRRGGRIFNLKDVDMIIDSIERIF